MATFDEMLAPLSYGEKCTVVEKDSVHEYSQVMILPEDDDHHDKTLENAYIDDAPVEPGYYGTSLFGLLPGGVLNPGSSLARRMYRVACRRCDTGEIVYFTFSPVPGSGEPLPGQPDYGKDLLLLETKLVRETEPAVPVDFEDASQGVPDLPAESPPAPPAAASPRPAPKWSLKKALMERRRLARTKFSPAFLQLCEK